MRWPPEVRVARSEACRLEQKVGYYQLASPKLYGLLSPGPLVGRMEQSFPERLKEADKTEEFLRAWVRNIFEGLSVLSEEKARKVLYRPAIGCSKFYLELVGWDLSKMDLEGWIRSWEGLGVKVTSRPGWSCLLYEFRPGKCECPLVDEGILPLTSRLCSTCFTNWLKHQVEAVSGQPVEVELVESLATGADRCVFRIWIGRKSL